MKSLLMSFPRFTFMFVMAAIAAATLFVACNRDEVASVKPAPASDPLVDYYMNMVSEVTASGNSVFFNLEDGSQLENPNREQITQYLKNIKERAMGDQFTAELYPITGQFDDARVNCTDVGISFGFSGCMTSGNVYILSGKSAQNFNCTAVTASFSGSAGCLSSGQCKVVIKRLTTADLCICAPFVTVVNTPTNGTISLGQYCCELTGTCYN